MATAGEAPRLPSGGWALRQQLWDRGLQEEAEQHRPSMAIAVSDPVAQGFCALILVWQPSMNPLVNSRPSSHRARMAGRQRLIACAHAYPSVWSQAAAG